MPKKPAAKTPIKADLRVPPKKTAAHLAAKAGASAKGEPSKKPEKERPRGLHARLAVGLFTGAVLFLGVLALQEWFGLTPQGTDIKLLTRFSDPNRPHQAVVAREGVKENFDGGVRGIGATEIGLPTTDIQAATIYVHPEVAPVSEENIADGPTLLSRKDVQTAAEAAAQIAAAGVLESLKATQNEVAELKQHITEFGQHLQAQQQMVYMTIQNQTTQQVEAQKQRQTLQTQIEEQARLNAQRADTTLLQQRLTAAELRQDVLFFFEGWHQGLLQGADLEPWRLKAEAAQNPRAVGVATRFIESLNTFGCVTDRVLLQAGKLLLQTVQTAQTTPAAAVPVAPAVTEVVLNTPQEEAQGQEPAVEATPVSVAAVAAEATMEGEPLSTAILSQKATALWAKLKGFLGRFITFEKIDPEVETATLPPYTAEIAVLEALLKGDESYFWAHVFEEGTPFEGFGRFQALAQAYLQQQGMLSGLYQSLQ